MTSDVVLSLVSAGVLGFDWLILHSKKEIHVPLCLGVLRVSWVIIHDVRFCIKSRRGWYVRSQLAGVSYITLRVWIQVRQKANVG